MGSKNTTPDKPIVKPNAENVNLFDYSKMPWANKHLDTYIDPSRGISIPYLSNKNLYGSEVYDPVLCSENPQYIEFIICQGDINELREKFAVHEKKPSHKCKGNCYCIKKMITSDKNAYGSESIDPTLRAQLLASVTSNDGQDTESLNVDTPTRDRFLASNTSIGSETDKPKIGYLDFFNKFMNLDPKNPKALEKNNQNHRESHESTCKIYIKGGNCNCSLTSPYSPTMKGGAESNTSDNKFTDSDEENDETLSTTSDMDDTSDEKNNAKKSKKQHERSEIDDDILDEDESDDIDDDELDVDDEVIEDGYILEQSDIETSDLYKLQNNIFSSETDDDVRMMNRNSRKTKKNKRNDNKRNNMYDDDTATTDQIRDAMKIMNERNNIFDTESREILRMNSDTDKYLKRPPFRSNKYH